MKVVILAGGGGTRLWPLSRETKPKQIQPFLDKETLLQKTYKRIRRGFSASDIFVATNGKFSDLVRAQLPQVSRENFFIEPVRRDTAAAIGLVAALFYRENPKTIFTTANSDHFIKNEKEYLRVLKLSGKVVADHPDHTVLLGLNPVYPETGYGYIQMDGRFKEYGKDHVFRVKRFIEKPPIEKAKEFQGKWEYLWNPGMFVWRADTLLQLFAKHLSAMHAILMRIAKDPRRLATEFAKIKPISIDYGIMEKTKKLLVIPADFGWSDIGHWKTIYDALSTNGENVVRGKHVGLDSSGNLIYSLTGKMVTTIGVKDMIVIETEDAILVCPKDRAQDVKKVVAELERKGMRKYL